MDQFSYRKIEDFPGVLSFRQIIIDVSSDVNDFLEVETDICTYTEESHQSKSMAKIVGELIEAHLNYMEIIPNKSPTTRDQYPVPSIFQERFLHLQKKIRNIKGGDPSIEKTTFNFDIMKSEGGFEY